MGIIQDDKKYVWHPFTQHFTAEEPLPIVRAEGTLLFDDKGNQYIDANSSWWVNTHGHGHPHIAKAISEQFSTLDHVVFAGVTHPKAVELAKRISNVLPSELEKVFFSDNGSTAVEVAIKMVIQFWHNQGKNKKRFLALEGSYHGDTFGAMSVGARGYFNQPFEPYFFEAEFLPFPTEKNKNELFERAEKLFSTGEFAGFIVEPLVQGASGMRMYSSEILEKLASIAKKHDVKLIFDEVMTGFGRTGKLFASVFISISPDFVCLSKGLTAGVMALGLTVTTNEIYNAFLSDETTKALLHGHSFTANPIACAVACASLDIFEEEDTWKNIRRIEEWNQQLIEKISAFDCVTNCRIQGTIVAFEIKENKDASYFSDVKTKAYNFFKSKGILLRPLGNVIFVNPPFCVSTKELKKVESGILDFLVSTYDKK